MEQQQEMDVTTEAQEDNVDSGVELGQSDDGQVDKQDYIAREEHQKEVDRRVHQALQKRESEFIKQLEAAKADGYAQVETLQSELRQAQRKSTFVTEAVKQSVHDADVAYLIVETESDKYQTDNGVDWEKLRTDKPYLFPAQKTTTYGGVRPENGHTLSMNDLIRRETGRL